MTITRNGTWTREDRGQLALRVLELLPEPAGAPVSTGKIRDQFPQMSPYERDVRVRRALDWLTAAGLAERVRVPEYPRVVFWRLTEAGEEAKKRGSLPTAD